MLLCFWFSGGSVRLTVFTNICCSHSQVNRTISYFKQTLISLTQKVWTDCAHTLTDHWYQIRSKTTHTQLLRGRTCRAVTGLGSAAVVVATCHHLFEFPDGVTVLLLLLLHLHQLLLHSLHLWLLLLQDADMNRSFKPGNKMTTTGSTALRSVVETFSASITNSVLFEGKTKEFSILDNLVF